MSLTILQFFYISAWQPPRDEGGRTDITYRVASIFPTHRAAKLVYTPAQDEIHSTFVRVQGVEPNTEYKFRVYSQNGVSKVSCFGSKKNPKLRVFT
ncbi:MAG: fibronectin type III domain-containing protein [Gammaproteobacteria bacterium]|nr:fibronectin type III domain-containing protein [Gammaproteobacteria bacterium]